VLSGGTATTTTGLTSPTATTSFEAPPTGGVASPWNLGSWLQGFGGKAAAAPTFGSRENAVIIFDWDDTLCPTTSGDAASGEALAAHARAAEAALRAASRVGHVEIVTMAGEGWVEETIRRYMPGLRSVLEELEIPVRLARASVPAWRKREAFRECRDPSHFLKRWTMKKVISDFYRCGATGKPRSWKNVMSIGDSDAERLALQDVVLWRSQREECRCKVVTFKAEPSVAELSAQLAQVAEALPTFVRYDGDLDLAFDHGDGPQCW